MNKVVILFILLSLFTFAYTSKVQNSETQNLQRRLFRRESALIGAIERRKENRREHSRTRRAIKRLEQRFRGKVTGKIEKPSVQAPEEDPSPIRRVKETKEEEIQREKNQFSELTSKLDGLVPPTIDRNVAKDLSLEFKIFNRKYPQDYQERHLEKIKLLVSRAERMSSPSPVFKKEVETTIENFKTFQRERKEFFMKTKTKMMKLKQQIVEDDTQTLDGWLPDSISSIASAITNAPSTITNVVSDPTSYISSAGEAMMKGPSTMVKAVVNAPQHLQTVGANIANYAGEFKEDIKQLGNPENVYQFVGDVKQMGTSAVHAISETGKVGASLAVGNIEGAKEHLGNLKNDLQKVDQSITSMQQNKAFKAATDLGNKISDISQAMAGNPIPLINHAAGTHLKEGDDALKVVSDICGIPSTSTLSADTLDGEVCMWRPPKKTLPNAGSKSPVGSRGSKKSPRGSKGSRGTRGTKKSPRRGSKKSPRRGSKKSPRRGSKKSPRRGSKAKRGSKGRGFKGRRGSKKSPRRGSKKSPRRGSKGRGFKGRRGSKKSPRRGTKKSPRRGSKGRGFKGRRGSKKSPKRGSKKSPKRPRRGSKGKRPSKRPTKRPSQRPSKRSSKRPSKRGSRRN